MGNLHSLYKQFNRMGYYPIVSNNPAEIVGSDRIVLPGVGHFGKGMQNIQSLGIKESILDFALILQRPILGICLGMQLLTDFSEEGDTIGLNLIDGKTIRFQNLTHKIKIPHMGWNSIQLSKHHPILTGIQQNEMFYFVHAYHVVCENEVDVLTTTEYGYSFTSAIARDNIIGIQFHPEKSHDWGLRILKNFCEF